MKKSEEQNEKSTDYWLKSRNVLSRDATNKKLDQYRLSAVFSIINNEVRTNTGFIYSGLEMILMLTGGSPRNFMRICDEMWSSIYSSISNSKYPINADLQSISIHRASGTIFQKIDADLPKNVKVSPKTMTERLAKSIKDFFKPDALRIIAERMSLKTDKSKLKENDKDSFGQIIDYLLMSETLKIGKDKEDKRNEHKIKLALNPMLTPYFNLPYRSPFSQPPLTIEPTDLLQIFTENEKDYKTIWNNIYQTYIKTKKDDIAKKSSITLSLFDKNETMG